MDQAMQYPLGIINLIHLLPPILGNAFISSVNIMDLIKQKSLCVTDQLITGISMFSLLLQFLELTDWFSHLIHTASIFEGDQELALSICFMILLLCYLWFCSWLCVHFCLKIVNINQRFYVRLQRGFPKMFPWILIPSIFGPVLASFFVFHKFSSQPNTTLNISNETLWLCGMGQSLCSDYIYIAVSLLGFLLCSISGVTIIRSLYRHVRRMWDNAEHSKRPNMEVQIRAVKTVTCILVLNVIMFTDLILTMCFHDSVDWQYALTVSGSICHVLSSLNLIKGNNKLDRKLSDILSRCLFCKNPTISEQ
ncbi:taste receptor type 2 member 40-like [Pelodytes ibericus]